MDDTQLVQRIYHELCLARQQHEANNVQSPITLPLLQACSLYFAKCFHSWNTASLRGEAIRNGGLSLTDIVDGLGINIFDFVKRLPEMLEILRPKFSSLFGTTIEAEWVQRVKEWRRLLVYSLILSKKYKELFKFIFNVNSESLLENKVFRFGWVMFILEKSRLLQEFPDLENCWNLGFQSLLKRHNLERAKELSTLEKLAIANNVCGAGEHEKLKMLMKSVESSIFDLLNSQIDVQNQKSFRKENPPMCDSAENVLDPERNLLDDFLEVLDSKYTEYLYSIGDCDERLFIQTQSKAPASSQSLTIPPHSSFSRLPLSFMKIFHQSHSSSMNEWISQFCEKLSTQPSTELQTKLGSSDKEQALIDLTTSVHAQARKIFSVADRDNEGLSMEATYAIQIFYLSLERFLGQDQEKGENLSVLSSKVFPLTLMACAFEIIIFVFKLDHLTLSVLLDHLQLKAFDLSKMTECFIKRFPDLPQSVRSHFQSLEHQIIETLAWAPRSSIYPLISHLSFFQPPCQTQNEDDKEPYFPVSKDPIPGLSLDKRSASSAFKIFPASNTEKEQSTEEVADLVVEGIPEALGPSEEFQKITSLTKAVIEDFFRKELKLMSQRLLEFKSALDFSPISPNVIMIQIYQAMKYALYEQTSLFYNRHLDQLLMCGLYGVCKVNKVPVTFREIVAQYKLQPRHQPDVCKFVIMEQSNPAFIVEKSSDIIEFYNVAFIPRMQEWLAKSAAFVERHADSK